MLNSYLEKWKLTEPALLASTPSSQIYKVLFEGRPAVLKFLTEAGQKYEGGASAVLRHLKGNGVVELLNADDGAHLLAYLDGKPLRELTEHGKDAEAAEIIASLTARMHSVKATPPHGLRTIRENFRALFKHAQDPSAHPIFPEAARIANHLLDTEKDEVVLHGDIHHENILHSSAQGWLAIDPQCLIGERTYDLGNTFFNPRDPSDVPASLERIQLYAGVFSRKLQLDPQRILKFAFAYGCLSACWEMEDGNNPARRIRIATLIRGLI